MSATIESTSSISVNESTEEGIIPKEKPLHSNIHISSSTNTLETLQLNIESDLESIHSLSEHDRNSQEDDASSKVNKDKKNVRFSTIEIRLFDRTIGDNPSCSDGVPITLDWNYTMLPAKDLQEYEDNRIPKRNKNHLALTKITRKNQMHTHFGYSYKEIEKASKKIEKVKKHREATKYLSRNTERVQEIGENVKHGLQKVLFLNRDLRYKPREIYSETISDNGTRLKGALVVR
ncbi:hypothetical protein CTEN210_14058 [Chaetoceros tenuissimus]|uniref:Uncharacterized protein n=1 Tax=Chaetoceros tenuissimus TaxID=426638 RepID=A0AAD3D474_9STRA|nr:hypothetical protein CTEN210_14058 [Chaetoceros tenuissimus]